MQRSVLATLTGKIGCRLRTLNNILSGKYEIKSNHIQLCSAPQALMMAVHVSLTAKALALAHEQPNSTLRSHLHLPSSLLP